MNDTHLYCCHHLGGSLEYGRLYEVVSDNGPTITVFTRHGGKKKYPSYCFSAARPPIIRSITLEDLDDPELIGEATVTLDTGELRLINLGTAAALEKLLKGQHYLAIPNLVILRSFNEESARKAIMELYLEGELLASSVDIS